MSTTAPASEEGREGVEAMTCCRCTHRLVPAHCGLQLLQRGGALDGDAKPTSELANPVDPLRPRGVCSEAGQFFKVGTHQQPQEHSRASKEQCAKTPAAAEGHKKEVHRQPTPHTLQTASVS